LLIANRASPIDIDALQLMPIGNVRLSIRDAQSVT
jgi:hypothetical protein